jgi:hypothetical protein
MKQWIIKSFGYNQKKIFTVQCNPMVILETDRSFVIVLMENHQWVVDEQVTRLD